MNGVLIAIMAGMMAVNGLGMEVLGTITPPKEATLQKRFETRQVMSVRKISGTEQKITINRIKNQDYTMKNMEQKLERYLDRKVRKAVRYERNRRKIDILKLKIEIKKSEIEQAKREKEYWQAETERLREQNEQAEQAESEVTEDGM